MWGWNPGPPDSESDALPPGHRTPLLNNQISFQWHHQLGYLRYVWGLRTQKSILMSVRHRRQWMSWRYPLNLNPNILRTFITLLQKLIILMYVVWSNTYRYLDIKYFCDTQQKINNTHLSTGYPNFGSSIYMNPTVWLPADAAADSVGYTNNQCSSCLTVSQSHQCVRRLTWKWFVKYLYSVDFTYTFCILLQFCMFGLVL